MAETLQRAGLAPRSPLAGRLVPGRVGRADGKPGLWLRERSGFQLVSLAARAGQAEALTAALGQAHGVVLPVVPRCVTAADGLTFIWSGPARWLVLGEGADHAGAVPVRDLEAMLRDSVGALASVTDLSDGRSLLRLGGPTARAALAKGLPIDLHPRAFRPGHVALTSAAHINLSLWQVDDGPTYDIAVFRGFAESFATWLLDAAAEFGIEILPGA